ncbi:MAG: hypothetical protein HY050_00170 [Actinobacteria bacterium]|nr:hypothetical protein [Actinomycetota bacterium]
MRAYVAATLDELSEMLEKKTFRYETAYILTTAFAQSNPEMDNEELEFELSWIAAQRSRTRGVDPLGFVLAVDLLNAQLGDALEDQVRLLSDIQWSQVESILVSESEESELTWYASQELATYLPAWKA